MDLVVWICKGMHWAVLEERWLRSYLPAFHYYLSVLLVREYIVNLCIRNDKDDKYNVPNIFQDFEGNENGINFSNNPSPYAY